MPQLIDNGYFGGEAINPPEYEDEDEICVRCGNGFEAEFLYRVEDRPVCAWCVGKCAVCDEALCDGDDHEDCKVQP